MDMRSCGLLNNPCRPSPPLSPACPLPGTTSNTTRTTNHHPGQRLQPRQPSQSSLRSHPMGSGKGGSPRVWRTSATEERTRSAMWPSSRSRWEGQTRLQQETPWLFRLMPTGVSSTTQSVSRSRLASLRLVWSSLHSAAVVFLMTLNGLDRLRLSDMIDHVLTSCHVRACSPAGAPRRPARPVAVQGARPDGPQD